MAELLPWHHMSAPDVLVALDTKREGLKVEEVKARQLQEGVNTLVQEKPQPAIYILLRQFASPFLIVLAFAAFLSAFLGHLADTGLILAIILVNVFLGFFQEYKADRAFFKLRSMLPSSAKVRRNNEVVVAKAEEIVAGDIILLSAGDKITADGRLISLTGFKTGEASLTGESNEVTKAVDGVAAEAVIGDQASMVFAGTIVLEGKAEVVVTAIGGQTAFGRVAELVARTEDAETPLQGELRRFSRQLVLIMCAAAIGIFFLGTLQGVPLLDMLATSAALAVAAVPEGLLVSLTVILAVGMRRMLKRHALVRRMLAAETLGGVSVMCVDKTGTLTTGEMTVTELRTGVSLVDLNNLDLKGKELLQALSIVKTAVAGQGSPTDRAVHTFLADYDHHIDEKAYTVVDELLFDSRLKYSGRLARKGAADTFFVWGAPDILLSHCDVEDSELQAYHKTLEDMTKRGLRVLLVAKREEVKAGALSDAVMKDLIPLGFVGLTDPLRPHARETIIEAARAGVRTVIVTGDHAETAAVVARALGIPVEPANILTGAMLKDMSDEELKERAHSASVFARVLPEQKVRILEAYRSLGHVVAMTGDGVNDAPALRAADIGVAVGSGTDVAKETADMVILDDDIASIVAAIREGRTIFENIRKVIAYLLIFSMGEAAVIGAALVLGFPLPFSPLHILWINLITDGLPAMTLAFEPGDGDIMTDPPRKKSEPIITPKLRKLMIFAGTLSVVGLVLLQAYLVQSGATEEIIRTYLFLSLGFDSLLAIFAFRSLRKSFLRVKHGRNPLLLAVSFLSFLLLLLPVLEPNMRSLFGFDVLGLSGWMIIGALSVAKFFILEAGKIFILSNHRRTEEKLI